jgi:hypothetical protein
MVTFSAAAGKFARVSSVALQSDGKIVVAGYGEVSAATGRDIMIARLTSAGALDTSFGAVRRDGGLKLRRSSVGHRRLHRPRRRRGTDRLG